jgi:hypothetical protein
MELGKFNTFVTEVVDITCAPVRKGVEGVGAVVDSGIAVGIAGGELVAGALVAAMPISRLI